MTWESTFFQQKILLKKETVFTVLKAQVLHIWMHTG